MKSIIVNLYHVQKKENKKSFIEQFLEYTEILKK